MKRNVGLFLFALSLSAALGTVAGCAKPVPAVSHKTVGDLTVTLTATPPPHLGDNTFSITLADAATLAPIGHANITATPEMLSPRTPGTPSSGRAQGNGLYAVPVRLGIATRYDIALHIERPGKPAADISCPVDAEE